MPDTGSAHGILGSALFAGTVEDGADGKEGEEDDEARLRPRVRVLPAASAALDGGGEEGPGDPPADRPQGLRQQPPSSFIVRRPTSHPPRPAGLFFDSDVEVMVRHYVLRAEPSEQSMRLADATFAQGRALFPFSAFLAMQHAQFLFINKHDVRGAAQMLDTVESMQPPLDVRFVLFSLRRMIEQHAQASTLGAASVDAMAMVCRAAEKGGRPGLCVIPPPPPDAPRARSSSRSTLRVRVAPTSAHSSICAGSGPPRSRGTTNRSPDSWPASRTPRPPPKSPTAASASSFQWCVPERLSTPRSSESTLLNPQLTPSTRNLLPAQVPSVLRMYAAFRQSVMMEVPERVQYLLREADTLEDMEAGKNGGEESERGVDAGRAGWDKQSSNAPSTASSGSVGQRGPQFRPREAEAAAIRRIRRVVLVAWLLLVALHCVFFGVELDVLGFLAVDDVDKAGLRRKLAVGCVQGARWLELAARDNATEDIAAGRVFLLNEMDTLKSVHRSLFHRKRDLESLDRMYTADAVRFRTFDPSSSADRTAGAGVLRDEGESLWHAGVTFATHCTAVAHASLERLADPRSAELRFVYDNGLSAMLPAFQDSAQLYEDQVRAVHANPSRDIGSSHLTLHRPTGILRSRAQLRPAVGPVREQRGGGAVPDRLPRRRRCARRGSVGGPAPPYGQDTGHHSHFQYAPVIPAPLTSPCSACPPALLPPRSAGGPPRPRPGGDPRAGRPLGGGGPRRRADAGSGRRKRRRGGGGGWRGGWRASGAKW